MEPEREQPIRTVLGWTAICVLYQLGCAPETLKRLYPAPGSGA